MKTSAGIVLYKEHLNKIYFFLVHPGGPYWKKKDAGAWSIPKGEILGDENPLERAKLEFQEETGMQIDGAFTALSPIKQKSGKLVMAWAVKGNIANSGFSSNLIDIEWPPRSGKSVRIPEVDQWEWFSFEDAQKRINPAQIPLLMETFRLATGT